MCKGVKAKISGERLVIYGSLSGFAIATNWSRGDLYGNSIAVTIRSFDHSLFTHLILAPTIRSVEGFLWEPHRDQVKRFRTRVTRFSLDKCLTQFSTCRPAGALEFGVSMFLQTCRPAGAKRLTQSRNRSIVFAPTSLRVYNRKLDK